MNPPGEHIVVYHFPTWGHTRPLVHLAARFVKLGSPFVTFLTTNDLFDRVTKEFARSFDSNDQDARRIRIISVGNIEPFGASEEAFDQTWKALIAGEELVCAQTSNRHDRLPKPQVFIADMLRFGSVNSVRTISGRSVKVFVWSPGMVAATIYLFGPERLGGLGDIRKKIEDGVCVSGRAYNEVAREQVAAKGKPIMVPGVPSMYDYELHPQEFPIPEELRTLIYPQIYPVFEAADGVFLFTPTSYESEAVAAVKNWFSETGRPAYACGPLLPMASKATADAMERAQSTESDEILKFLDRTLVASGENRLLYFSFGSFFWPVSTPHYVWAFLDIVMDLQIPFIYSHAANFSPVPDEVKHKIQAYGKGLLSPWAPQQLILNHPATGWFVTHGGQNSVTEAICAGVPLILWPFEGDQPINASRLADTLQVGYELIEVRTGLGLQPMLRSGRSPVGTLDAVKAEARDTLTRAFGDDGARLRENLGPLRRALLGEWEEGGASRRDVVEFLNSL